MNRIATAFLGLILILIPLELASRVFIRLVGDPLQKSRLVLESDEKLLWRQRPGLDTAFLGKRMKTDSHGFREPPEENEKNPEILILGPSSTFGWGVEAEETYSYRLHELTGKRVWNSGEIGYSIAQGSRLYSMLRGKISPQAVVLAYGINDLDHFRFFAENGPTDEALFAAPRTRSFHAGEASAFLGLISRAIEELGIYSHCGLASPPLLRVPFPDFEAELRRMIALVREDGARPILLNTVFSPAPRPAHSEDSDRLYLEASAASSAGNCSLSRMLFREARLNETDRVARDVKILNALIEKIANDEKVARIDLSSITGTGLLDPVHFSAEGHRKIAERLRDALVSKQ